MIELTTMFLFIQHYYIFNIARNHNSLNKVLLKKMSRESNLQQTFLF